MFLSVVGVTRRLIVAEFFGDGGGVQLSLVRRLRGGEDFRADRVPTVPEGYVNFWSEVLHNFLGFVRFCTDLSQFFDSCELILVVFRYLVPL